MASEHFDIIVIGSGPGGYVAAIRAGQLGLKTAIIEKADIGGTCLNVGCIPSKALLHSTEYHAFARNHAAEHGLRLEDPVTDLPALMARKHKVVGQLNQGVEGLLKKNKVKVVRGLGSLAGANKVTIENGKDSQTLSADHIILATGSKSIELPFLKFDGEHIVSSTEAIAFDSVPERLVVVGAGAIGLELGSVWARLGSDVTVVEMLPQIAPGFDKDVADAAQKIFENQGLNVTLCTKVTGYEIQEGKVNLSAEKDGKPLAFTADKVLVAIGRCANTEGVNLESVGITTNQRGCIETDAHFRTNAPGIYAIGDVRPGPMLAHKAEEEGVACVERIAGKAGHVNYDVIPGVVYTDPEIALVGLTEETAKERNIAYKKGKFNFMANGRALANATPDGFVKVIAHKETDRLLGVQVLGHNAGELIANAVAHMEYGGSAEDLARTVHAHPTMSEAIKEAAMAVDKSAIHS